MRRILLLFLLAPWCARALDLTGEISTEAGAPLPEVTVMILAAGPRVGSSPLCPYTYPDCGKQSLTDDAGRFQLPSLDPAMNFCIIAIAAGFEPATNSSLLPEKGPVKMKLRARDLAKLPPEHVINGRILGPAGEPVAGAVISVEGVCKGESTQWGGNSQIDSMTVSDLQGEFHLVSRQDLSAAHALVSAPGRCPRWFRLEPAKMSLLRLKAGSAVSGRLLLDGQPLTGVALDITTDDRTCGKFITDLHATTDPDGRFYFQNVPAGEKLHLFGLMNALKKNSAAFLLDFISAADEEATPLGDVIAGPSYRLTGQVVLADGEKIPPKTRLMLTRKSAWDQQLIELSEDGSFSAEGVPGEQVEIHIRVPGYHSSPKNPNLDLWDRSTFSGRVTGDVSGLKILLEPGKALTPAYADFQQPTTEAMEAAAQMPFRSAP